MPKRTDKITNKQNLINKPDTSIKGHLNALNKIFELEKQIHDTASLFSQKGFSYEELCWLLVVRGGAFINSKG